MNNFVAIAINKDYWVCLSTPTTKENAKMFEGSEMIGETFAIKSVEEIANYKKVI